MVNLGQGQIANFYRIKVPDFARIFGFVPVLKLKIVIYGMNYAPEIAGVGRYTGEIGEYLASLGHEVCVITTQPHYPGWKVRAPRQAGNWVKETLAGVVVYRTPIKLHDNMSGMSRLIAPLSFALSSAPIAFWQILTRRPHVVIAIEPTLFVAPIGLMSGKLVGAKLVLHVQDLEIDAAFAVGHLKGRGFLRLAAAAFEYAVLGGFDRIITISGRMGAHITSKGVAPARIEVVRNWVDLDKICPMSAQPDYRRELGLRVEAFVVLYSGNIGAKQGVGMIIETARALSDHSDIVIVVAGDGPMRKEVEKAAEHLNNLRIFDFQPEARFSEFLAIADVHLIPQERSAADLLLPSKLGGMLASGRRIVVTADPGTELAEFLDNSCTLTAPGDVEALASALSRLATEPPCLEKQDKRLSLARELDKKLAIARFGDTALFLDADTTTNTVRFSVDPGSFSRRATQEPGAPIDGN